MLKETKHILTILSQIVKDDADVSLLDKRQSTVIKGLLIALIVLGHDRYLMVSMNCFVFLYSFHIYDFYFLPFLYDYHRKSILKLIATNLRRFYVTYTITFVAIYFIAFRSGYSPSPIDMITTYLCGSQVLFTWNFGIGNFMWFIPTMFSLLIIRAIYYNSNFACRILLLSISLLSLLAYAYKWGFSFDAFIYSPMCLSIAFAMLLPAIIARHIILKTSHKYINLLFFILVLCVLTIYGTRDWIAYNTLNRIISPILMLVFIVSLTPLLIKIKIFEALGNNSFKIYIIHIFLYNISYVAVERVMQPTLFVGFLLFIAVLTLSYLISKIKLLNLIFPR